ncbi:mobilome CxxCx(11)CxxC protein [Dyadobacter linearis]|nr:mobilome CxxCx(11)CxxC protein [Dyadobacter sp. CECT 9623]
MSDEDRSDTIQADCWNRALDCFAYNYIYAGKLNKISPWLQWSKVLGIIVPVLIGAILTTYANDSKIIDLTIAITSPFAIAQLVVSTYITVSGLEEKAALFSSQTIQFSLLNSEFQSLGLTPLPSIDIYQARYEVLKERERSLSVHHHQVSEEELRKGMRSGLRNYQRECAGCKTVPLSMISTNCPVCGNF